MSNLGASRCGWGLWLVVAVGCEVVDVDDASWRAAMAEGDSGSDGTPDAIAEDAPPSPESDECGWSRPVIGSSNGRPIYGPPSLDQNNCTDGKVCGRPAFDACTPTEASQFTCGCVDAAAACDPATIARDLASSDYATRADAERRAIDCCWALGQPSAAFVDGLGTAVGRLDPPSAEAGARYDVIANACVVPECRAEARSVPGKAQDECVITQGCTRGMVEYYNRVPLDGTCLCLCGPPPR